MSFEQKSTILVILALVSGRSLFSSLPANAADSVRLAPRRIPGQLTAVDYQIKVGGELKINAVGKEISKLPINVDADLEYQERILAVGENQALRRSVRYYATAIARIDVDGRPSTSELDEGRRLIVHQLGQENRSLFSPLGPLARHQLELIDVPGNSSTLDALLPGRSVDIGDQWSHDPDVIAALLGLEAVASSNVQSKLVRRDGDEVVLEAQGKVDGAVGGVSTRIKIEARYRFHVAHGFITFFAMDIEEDRSIGHVSPGYDIAARVQVSVAPLADAPELAEDRLNSLTLETSPGMKLLDYRSSEGGFRFHHGRQWHVMMDRGDVTVLRMVDRGELVAQCNISSLTDLKPDEPRNLESFQSDIKTALDDVIGEFVAAEQYQTDSGLEVLRVVASGKVDELPIHWIYYHVANDGGRRVAYVVTLEPKLEERMAGSDRQFAEHFRFTPRPEPVPAVQQGGEAATELPAEDSQVVPEQSAETGTPDNVDVDVPQPTEERELDSVATSSPRAAAPTEQDSTAPEPTSAENKDKSSTTSTARPEVKLPSRVGEIRGRIRR